MSAAREGNVTTTRFRTIAEELRRGGSPASIRARFSELVTWASVAQVGPLFLELVAEGGGHKEIRQLVDWFGELGSESDGGGPECHLSGHPLETFQRENEALQLRVDRCRTAMVQLPSSANAFSQVRDALRELAQIDNHYRRQEFLLFTRLEHHGLVRPGRILWAAHDEIRQWLRYLDLQFASDEFGADSLSEIADSVALPLFDDIEWVAYLENRVLLPMACESLEQADWEIVGEHSPKIGWCLIEPGWDYQPAASAAREDMAPTAGVLGVETMALIHAELPVDLTFIDAQDRVAYFAEGSRPVFYRSKAILGRDVRNCHPPRSVHYVDQILSDFKSGRETSAQFWKPIGDQFVHIRFVALRDTDGSYLGTLEIAQDITHLRTLEGRQVELRYDRSE
jgi:hypothetical protein